jgi:hypothetical protein
VGMFKCDTVRPQSRHGVVFAWARQETAVGKMLVLLLPGGASKSIITLWS